ISRGGAEPDALASTIKASRSLFPDERDLREKSLQACRELLQRLFLAKDFGNGARRATGLIELFPKDEPLEELDLKLCQGLLAEHLEAGRFDEANQSARTLLERFAGKPGVKDAVSQLCRKRFLELLEGDALSQAVTLANRIDGLFPGTAALQDQAARDCKKKIEASIEKGKYSQASSLMEALASNLPEKFKTLGIEKLCVVPPEKPVPITTAIASGMPKATFTGAGIQPVGMNLESKGSWTFRAIV